VDTTLQGLTVVVTRTRAQASALVRLLEDRGARALEVPVIEVVDATDGGRALASAVGRLAAGGQAWVVVGSPNSAERLLQDLAGRPLGGTQVAAIGPSTARVLTDAGVHVDLVPPEAVAESLVAAFPSPPSDPDANRQVLLPQAAVARDVLADGLTAAGWEVEVVEAYRTVPANVAPGMLDDVAAADVITFTSSSTVEHFCDGLGVDRVPAIVACIGPITSATARARGLTVDVEAAVHTVPGLVDALVAHIAGS
jgi:uroporphyrinogen III methyltransferase / synthase